MVHVRAVPPTLSAGRASNAHPRTILNTPDSDSFLLAKHVSPMLSQRRSHTHASATLLCLS